MWVGWVTSPNDCAAAAGSPKYSPVLKVGDTRWEKTRVEKGMGDVPDEVG